MQNRVATQSDQKSVWETRGTSVTLLLAGTLFLIEVAYLPGVLPVSTLGRWSVVTLVGLPTTLIFTVERFDWSRFEVRCLVGLFTWLVLSLLWSASPWDTAGYLLNAASLLGLGLLATRVEAPRLLWLGVALGALASLPVAFLEALGHPLRLSLVGSAFPEVVGGLFLGNSTLSEVGTVAALLMLLEKRWSLAILCGLTAALGARKEVGLMLLVAGLVWLVLTWGQRFSWRAAVSVLFGASVFLGLTAWLTTYHGELTLLGQLHNAVAGRLEIWTNTARALNFLGWGPGTYAGVSSTFAGYGAAHNEYLQFLFELGFGSVFLFGLGGYAFATQGHITERVVLSALGASALVWAPFQEPTTATLTVVLAGFLCGARARARSLASVRRADDLCNADWVEFVPATALRETSSDRKALALRP